MGGGFGKLLDPLGLFGGSDTPQVIAPPPVIPPPAMPLPDDAAAKRARRKSLAGQLQRSGRQSTILSDAVTDTQTLGG